MKKYIIALMIMVVFFISSGCSNISKELIDYSSNESSEISTSEEENHNLTPAYLKYVVDGDTLIVLIDGVETKVRLIGIDTPESVHNDESKNNVYGDMASEHTKEILKETETIYLQYDVEMQDDYGRTLAYVWLSNDVDVNDKEDVAVQMINAIILHNGYGIDKVYKPNEMYADMFDEICTLAEEYKSGLWQYEEFRSLW